MCVCVCVFVRVCGGGGGGVEGVRTNPPCSRMSGTHLEKQLLYYGIELAQTTSLLLWIFK